jgi:hypothetical protein
MNGAAAWLTVYARRGEHRERGIKLKTLKFEPEFGQ